MINERLTTLHFLKSIILFIHIIFMLHRFYKNLPQKFQIFCSRLNVSIKFIL